MRHEVEVESDFRQFYLWDAGTDPSPPDEYSEADVQNRVKVETHIIVVQPERDGQIPVVLSIHESDPACDRSQWDHVVECAIELPSGKLEIQSTSGDVVIRLDVAPGSYQARVLFAGLDSLSFDGLDGEDHYAIELWPGPRRPLKVSKRWIDPTE